MQLHGVSVWIPVPPEESREVGGGHALGSHARAAGDAVLNWSPPPLVRRCRAPEAFAAASGKRLQWSPPVALADDDSCDEEGSCCSLESDYAEEKEGHGDTGRRDCSFCSSTSSLASSHVGAALVSDGALSEYGTSESLDDVFAQERHFNVAAIKIQAWWRVLHACFDVERRSEAALRLQRAWRRQHARRALLSALTLFLATHSRAASRLQRAWRTWASSRSTTNVSDASQSKSSAFVAAAAGAADAPVPDIPGGPFRIARRACDGRRARLSPPQSPVQSPRRSPFLQRLLQRYGESASGGAPGNSAPTVTSRRPSAVHRNGYTPSASASKPAGTSVPSRVPRGTARAPNSRMPRDVREEGASERVRENATAAVHGFVVAADAARRRYEDEDAERILADLTTRGMLSYVPQLSLSSGLPGVGPAGEEDLTAVRAALTAGLPAGVSVLRIARIDCSPSAGAAYTAVRDALGPERLLWHGTSWESVANIACCGFNRAYAFGGRHGARLGRGTYFAEEPARALRFCGRSGGTRALFLAGVLPVA
eukprot:TRINITY_DN27053_c0_g1_i2.p1 TRINITY_DN27053_c0_g1~~TRINITY_DN27053_c0_g1_i2.p1  ORF type:complete len:541 (+),score=80.09 TRINITY_DN27053_c0_g1_i2:65-1687(+)